MVRDVLTEAFCCPIPLARVYRKSKQTEVAPRFYYLDRRMQDYIMLQLQFLVENNNDFLDADRKSLEKVAALYPDTKKIWFVKEFSSILLMEKNNDFNLKRIIRLFEYIGYAPYGLIRKIKKYFK